MKNKRLVAMLLAASMMMSLTACGDKEETESSSAESSSSSTASTSSETTEAVSDLSKPGEYPIWQGEGTPEISVLITENQWVSDFEDNAYTHWVEELGGVDLSFEFLPSNDTQQKLSTMVAGGSKLPDVISYALPLTVEKSFCESGAILDLTPFYEQGLAYNIDKAVAEFPDWNLVSNITSAEGKIYATPKIQSSPSNEVKYKMWINESWLDNVGLKLEDIKTTDDFRDMLRKFKEEDANGNGDANDEIPFMTSDGWGGTYYKFLTNAFVFEGDDDMLMLDNGTVVPSYTQDGWFESVDYIKSLVDEGLLSKDSFTNKNENVQAVVSFGNPDRVGAITSSSLSFLNDAANDPDSTVRLRYAVLDPLTGPDGVNYASYKQSQTQGLWHVTTYAENPELCFRLGDAQFTEEGFLRGRFGLEGENWAYTEDYKKDHPSIETEARYGSMGFEGKYLFYNDIFGTNQNINWYDQMPYFSGNVESEGAYMSKDENGVLMNAENSPTVRQETASGVYQNHIPGADVYCPSLHFTDEETETIAEIQANLKKFVNQERSNYCLGLDCVLSKGRDAYLNELNLIGLDTFMEICNTAYARQYK